MLVNKIFRVILLLIVFLLPSYMYAEMQDMTIYRHADFFDTEPIISNSLFLDSKLQNRQQEDSLLFEDVPIVVPGDSLLTEELLIETTNLQTKQSEISTSTDSILITNQHIDSLLQQKLDSIDTERTRDSLRLSASLIASLFRSWDSYNRTHPFDSTFWSLMQTIKVQENPNLKKQMEEADNKSKNQAAFVMDSILLEVDSMPKDYWLCYAQPSFLLPVIAYQEVPGKRFERMSFEFIRSVPKYDFGFDKKEKIFERQQEAADMRRMALHNFFIQYPSRVRFYYGTMAKAPEKERLPKEHVLDGTLVEVPDYVFEFKPLPARGDFSVDKWHYRGQNILQMTQTALSDNWYRGGENNTNLLSEQKLEIKRYDASKITTFEAVFDLKLSFYSTKSDTVHPMRLNDNLFRMDLKYGYKAWKLWYYSTSMTFKTPLFNLYGANSKTIKTAFLSPAELNVNVGMDYKYSKKGSVTYSLLLAPLSYSLKYVHSERVNVKNYGIDEGKRSVNQFGSSLTSKLEWVITNDIAWTSRLYYFTDYDVSLGEFENTFTFKVNRYFSARVSLYPRFDDSTDNKDWQMKETLTFGFDYVW